jgi:hypothetical protein
MKRFLSAIFLLWFFVLATNAAEERFLVSAKINDKPVVFALDTGSDCPAVLYSTAAQRLGLKVAHSDFQPGPGQVVVGFTKMCNLDFGVTNFQAPLGVLDIPANLKPPEDGVLGWPTIKNNIFSFDFKNHTFVFLTNTPAESLAWVKLRISTNNDDLTLELSANKSEKLILALDSGCVYGVKLNSQKWSEWRISNKNQPSTFESYYTPNPGFVVKEESWANQISLGALTLTDVPVMEADSSDIALHSSPQTKLEATLGLAALKRLDIVIDGKHGVAYLRPKTLPSLPYQHNRLGADFAPRDLHNDDLIAHVAYGSPAYQAGIRDGDVLLKEDGRDVTKWRTNTNPSPAIRPVMRPAGTKLKLTLRRGDKIFKTTAVLRNILPPDAPKNSN